jgi:mannose/fructose/N-acetylgalactosamine-specific phosphotransferase system component IIC
MTDVHAPSTSPARSLLANILGPLVLVAAVNATIFGLGWDQSFRPPQAGLLLNDIPGWFIGAVWTVLFLAMGWARWRLGAASHPAAASARLWLTILIVNCAVYPFYTAGLSSPALGFAGNLLTIALAAYVAILLKRCDRLATLAPVAVVCWVSFATVFILDQQRWLW